MSIRQKLIIGFAGILVLMGAMGLFALFTFGQINSAVSQMTDENITALEYAHHLRSHIIELRHLELLHISSSRPETKALSERESKEAISEIERYLELYAVAVSAPEAETKLLEVEAAWSDYLGVHSALLEASDSDQKTISEDLFRSSLASYEELLGGLHDLVHIEETDALEAGIAASDTFNQGRLLLILIFIGAIVAGIVIGYFVSRSITGRVGGLIQATRKMAAGDLQGSVDDSGGDELAQLGTSMNAMAESLRRSQAEIERLYAAQKEEAEVSTALLSLSQNLPALAGLEKVLRTVVETTPQLVGCHHCRLYLWDNDAGELVPSQSWGLDEAQEESFTRLRLNQAQAPLLLRRILNEREPLAVEDASSDHLLPWEHRQAFGIRAALVMPMVGREGVVGTLFLDYCQGPRSLSRRERTIVAGIAHQAALAIENANLYEQLQRKEELQRQLLEKVIGAQEEERKRIARELHDETGQALTALAMGLAAMEEELPPGNDGIRRILVSTRDLAAQTLDDTHKLMLDLRPTLLDDLGLVPALRWYSRNSLERLGIEVNLEVQGVRERLPAPMETALFRIVQEAITNVARHSKAKAARVRLELADSTITAEVEDDGMGFNVDEVFKGRDGGLGLLGMEERAHLLGGELQLQTLPGHGTKVVLKVPLEGGR
jgi:signal transduction histidine kinase